MHRPRLFSHLLFAALLCICTGCGSGTPDDTPELGTVSGTVTMDGQPLANVTVSFQPADGPASYGTTDASGNYELTYTSGLKGAVVGSHVVRIASVTEGPPEPGWKEPVPEKYNAKSELTAQVASGDNPTTNFDLTSK